MRLARRIAALTRTVAVLTGGLTAVGLPCAATAQAVDVVDGWKTVYGHGEVRRDPPVLGKRIDRRLAPDIAWVVQRFHVYVTAGYSLSKVHQATGEHPRGLAVDLVPGTGGAWADLARLAKWAEPRQNEPRPPFKRVG